MMHTYKFSIKETVALDSLARISKNFYNQANYFIRQQYIKTGQYSNYFVVEKYMKTSKNLEGTTNYKLLPSQTSQQILKLLHKNWVSFFQSKKDYELNPDKYQGEPSIPKYRREDKYLLLFTNQNIHIKNNTLYLKKFGIKIKIPPYGNKNFKDFIMVRILPRNNKYECEIVYEEKDDFQELDATKHLSIDLGMNNLMAIVTNTEEKPLLINGRILKAVNQLYNKKIAKLKSIRTHSKDNTKRNDLKYFSNTSRMKRLTEKRNNTVKDYCHKVTTFVIKYCLKNRIGNICVGDLKGIKTSPKLSRRVNEQFQRVPLDQQKRMLKYKCEKVGIKFLEVDESYTSKCSALDLEPIEKHQKYFGVRNPRGLLKTPTRIINSDVNGALNILRKVIGNSFLQKTSNSRIWYNPIMIRDLNPNSYKCFI